MLAVLPAARSILLPLAALAAAASCGPGAGTEQRQPSSGDSSGSPAAASPRAPAAAAPSLPPGTPPESATRLRALLDSSAALDSAFQRERAALNDEARAMAGLDRRSDGYARRFDAFRARQAAAEQQRTARDRLRRRVDAMLARLGGATGSAAVPGQR